MSEKDLKKQKSDENLLVEAAVLLTELEKANTEFMRKTEGLLSKINQGLDELDRDFEDMDSELRKSEEVSLQEIDTATKDFLKPAGNT